MTEKTKLSIALDDMSLEQLIQVSQGLGRQIDALREQRVYLREKIDARLQAGERESAPGDAEATGAVIEAKAK